MTLEYITSEYLSGEYTVDKSQFSLEKVGPDYVFDEDLTIRQNRAMIKQWNTRVERDSARYIKKKAELENKMRMDVIEWQV